MLRSDSSLFLYHAYISFINCIKRNQQLLCIYGLKFYHFATGHLAKYSYFFSIESVIKNYCSDIYCRQKHNI